MLKSPVMHFVGMAVWVITALASIHMGLLAMGHDLIARFGLAGMNTNLMYFVGLCGVVSLIMFCISLYYKGSCCNNCSSCNY